MTPLKITMIPHDGGPCPVDDQQSVLVQRKEYCLVGSRDDWYCSEHIAYAGDIDWTRILTYCPIEIQEELK
jgi:hypothetical protein